MLRDVMPPEQGLAHPENLLKSRNPNDFFENSRQISKTATSVAAGIRTRVTGLGSLCHNRWTTAAWASIK